MCVFVCVHAYMCTFFLFLETQKLKMQDHVGKRKTEKIGPSCNQSCAFGIHKFFFCFNFIFLQDIGDHGFPPIPFVRVAMTF